MKKAYSLTCALCCLLSTMVMAASAESSQSGTTKLTTTVPAASYVMHIPADQTITFGKSFTDIGNVTITDASGFADKKNVEVTVTHDDFHSDSAETTIPYVLYARVAKDEACEKLIFRGDSKGTVSEKASLKSTSGYIGGVETLRVSIPSENWGKALAGDYTSTITFTSAVVVAK